MFLSLSMELRVLSQQLVAELFSLCGLFCPVDFPAPQAASYNQNCTVWRFCACRGHKQSRNLHLDPRGPRWLSSELGGNGVQADGCEGLVVVVVVVAVIVVAVVVEQVVVVVVVAAAEIAYSLGSQCRYMLRISLITYTYIPLSLYIYIYIYIYVLIDR